MVRDAVQLIGRYGSFDAFREAGSPPVGTAAWVAAWVGA